MIKFLTSSILKRKIKQFLQVYIYIVVKQFLIKNGFNIRVKKNRFLGH